MEKGKRGFKIIRRVIIALIVIAIVATAITANQLVKYAIGRDSSSGNRQVEENSDDSVDTEKDTQSIHITEYNQGIAWMNKTNYDEMSITTDDNLKINGRLYNGNSANHRYVILVHGYHCSMEDMASYAKHYYENGYSVLMMDLRAHGDSEGKYIGMGWLDKDDLIKWISTITHKDTNSKIILHGVSMGAATVMMAGGESLPYNVKAIIEDCGYTSAYDIFESELQKRFPAIPVHPTMDLASALAKAKAGYSFKEASALKQIKKCTTPTFFIHGTADDFVPCSMVDELYNAATCQKDLYKAEGAGHARAKDVNPQEYFLKVFSFIDANIK